MGLTKDKLIYDPTTPADGDSVAAFLHASAKLTSTNISGKEALDVNVANAIEVSIDHANDSIKIGDGTDLLAVNADGSINAVVSATDLDIRDLTDASDSVQASQKGTWTVGISANQSIGVTATDLDIRDLTDASDSVQASQKGTWTVGISAGQSIDVTATDLDIRNLTEANDSVLAKDCAQAMLNTAKAVSTSGVVVAASLTGRRRILFQNQGTKAVYVGPSGVSSANGIKVSAGANLEIPLGAGAALHAVAESGTQNCVLMELA